MNHTATSTDVRNRNGFDSWLEDSFNYGNPELTDAQHDAAVNWMVGEGALSEHGWIVTIPTEDDPGHQHFVHGLITTLDAVAE